MIKMQCVIYYTLITRTSTAFTCIFVLCGNRCDKIYSLIFFSVNTSKNKMIHLLFHAGTKIMDYTNFFPTIFASFMARI